MHFSSPIPKFITWVLISINLFSFSTSDPRISEAGLLCGTGRPPPNTSYIPVFVQEMEILSQRVTAHDFATYHLPNSFPPIYGLAQCFSDLSHTDCLLCYAASRTRLPRCLPAESGRIYLDGCFLRYDNYTFFNQTVDPSKDTVNCNTTLDGWDDGEKSRGVVGEFRNITRLVIENVTEIAVRNGGFGVMEYKGVFGLAQCWRTLTRNGCRECLEKAGRNVRQKCLPSKEGRGLNAGCYLRYSTQKFYNDESQTRHNDFSGMSGTGSKVAIALSALAFFVLLLCSIYTAHMRISKMKEERNTLNQISNSFTKGSLNFKYETLEKATDYFSNSRKIGQGGAGSVFKGTLPNGEIVAVKRLVFNTKQWVDEFFNEVNLISGIQHKNLVKLLGCSIEGPESLLVYEYVPNRSLDQFLFEKEKDQKVRVLNWKQRFEIILGTAEGLAYLHGGTHVRIIHRDIKSSNVLLDENLAPKVADFGLVRSFGTDMTHLSTGIAGTLGYMAPEYIVRGQLTEKADVYSFGVLVLEIVCGRKNIAFVEDSTSLLQTVWRLYQTGNLSETVDPSLKDDFPANEASKVLQIGLLCAQASAASRPSMDEVVYMLRIEDCAIPSPNQPPFMNGRKLHPGNNSDSGSSGLNSIISSALTKLETSYTSTEESSTVLSSGEPSRTRSED